MSLARFRLEHELRLWARAGHRPLIWWRDDDARAPSPALDRLLTVRGQLPISLAVIPDGDLAALSARLKTETGVSIAQHGVDHQNRFPAGGYGDRLRSEYPVGTPAQMIRQSILDAKLRLTGAGLAPGFYTPPWNEYDDVQLAALRAAGYGAFSAGVLGKPAGGLDHIGAEVDVLRWKTEPPHFKGEWRISRQFLRALQHRRRTGAFLEPVGLLTHHLVHDEATWDFLEWFGDWSRERFEWRGFGELEAGRKRAA